MKNLFNPPKFINFNFASIDLLGPDGNAFVVMGIFKNQAKKEGWPESEIQVVLGEAIRGDYDHLLETIKSHCKNE